MKTLKTYKSKSTGLILALLLLFGRTNNTQVATGFRSSGTSQAQQASVAATMPAAADNATATADSSATIVTTAAPDTARTFAKAKQVKKDTAASQPNISYSITAIADSGTTTPASTASKTEKAPQILATAQNNNHNQETTITNCNLQMFAFGKTGNEDNDTATDNAIVYNAATTAQETKSEVGTTYFTATLMYDTLVAAGNKDFLFNN